MKNKGLIMIALILAFCGVLSVYALTEGSTERIAVDADGITSLSYMTAGRANEDVEISDADYIHQIVAEINNLELRKANFKIKQSDLDEMSGIMILSGDVFAGEEPEFITLWFLPDNRVMAAWDGKEGLFNADYEQLDSMVSEMSAQTLRDDPYATAAIMFGIHEDMLED